MRYRGKLSIFLLFFIVFAVATTSCKGKSDLAQASTDMTPTPELVSPTSIPTPVPTAVPSQPETDLLTYIFPYDAQSVSDDLALDQALKRQAPLKTEERKNTLNLRPVARIHDRAAFAADYLKQVEKAASAPDCHVLYLRACPVGTAELLIRLRQKRPELITLLSDPEEDNTAFKGGADLILRPDEQHRAYMLPYLSKFLGSGRILYVQTQAETERPDTAHKISVLKDATTDLQLTFEKIIVDTYSPDRYERYQDYVAHVRSKLDSVFQGTDSIFSYETDLSRILALYVQENEAKLLAPARQSYPDCFVNMWSALQHDDQYLRVCSAQELNWPQLSKLMDQTAQTSGFSGTYAAWICPFDFCATYSLLKVAEQAGEVRQKFMTVSENALAIADVTPVNKLYQGQGEANVSAETETDRSGREKRLTFERELLALCRAELDRLLGSVSHSLRDNRSALIEQEAPCLYLNEDSYIFGQGASYDLDTPLPDEFN